jgi:2-succinyl-6-hydroxy-2,4-cyclohexadiene-1-carboxylate synthase
VTLPLVTLHGFTGTPAAWAAVPLGPATHLALIGHAPDLPVPPAWTFPHEVDRVANLVAPAAPVHLAGYSMGGRVALALAARRPDLVARLTIVSAHPGLDDPHAASDRRAADEAWCSLLEHAGLGAFVAAWEAQPLWHTQRALSPELLAAQRRSRLTHSPLSLAAALRALGLGAMPTQWPRLPSLPMPIDWVAGALDDKYTLLARRAAALTRRGRALILPATGHNPLLESPALLAQAIGSVPAPADTRSTSSPRESTGRR